MSRKGKVSIIILFVLLFLFGLAGGYLVYRSGIFAPKKQKMKETAAIKEMETVLRIYYPFGSRLQMEERKASGIKSRIAAAEAVVNEYMKGSNVQSKSHVPQGARLLGIYVGNDGILYANFSEEFRSSFQGDALEEYLLLRGLCESLLSNVYGVEGVKVLVDGKETESLGGHISLLYPLVKTASQGMTEGNEIR